jgi:hypothetical protein
MKIKRLINLKVFSQMFDHFVASTLELLTRLFYCQNGWFENTTNTIKIGAELKTTHSLCSQQMGSNKLECWFLAGFSSLI